MRCARAYAGAAGLGACYFFDISDYGSGLSSNFYIPWYSIAIAVFSVFAVVFVAMLYSMGKIRRENTIDTLKNENI